MSQIIRILGSILCTATIGYHCCTIYFCCTLKELKKVRFLRLVLFLSICDCAFGVEGLCTSLLNIFNSDNTVHKFLCRMMTNVISGTILSSLLHTLLICFERLNATFTTKHRILNMLTNNVSVGFCFVVPHCFTMVKFGIIASYGICPCIIECMVRPVSLICHDIPVTILIMLVTFVYGAVTIRMIKQQKTANLHFRGLTETQMAQAKNAALRMRRNLLTLGIIISVVVISAFPGTILRVYAYSVGSHETVESYLMVANNVFLLLAPLLDPFIYIFRVDKYRKKLISKCCFRPNAVGNTNE